MIKESKELGGIEGTKKPKVLSSVFQKIKDNIFSVHDDIKNNETGAQKEEEGKESKAGRFFGEAVKIGLYILTFLLPLFFLPFTNGVLEINKQLLLFVFSLVLLVFWLAGILISRKLEIKKSLLNVFIVVFIASVLISGLLSVNKFQAIIGFDNSISESFLTLACLAIIYFLASSALKEKKEINRLLFVLFGSAMLAAILGFLQLTSVFVLPWDFSRIASFNTVGSVNAFEIFLAAVLVLAATLFTEAKRPTWQLVALGVVSAILLFMVIALNFINVWWGLLGVMVMVLGFGLIKQGRATQTRLILAMVVLAMALLLSLTRINISKGWLNTPAEVSPSYGATIEIDKGALTDNLFFGKGPGSFGYSWELYRPTLINQTIFWNVRFNQGISKIFSMPASLGIIGAGLWILLIGFFAIWGAIKLISRKGENWTLAFALYSSWLFLSVMQFLYPTNLTLEFLFWLIMGLALFSLKSLGAEGETKENKEVVALSFSKESPLASVFSFLLVIFLVLTISLFYLGFNYWRADILFKNGVAASTNQGNLDKGYQDIAKAIELNAWNDNYLISLSQVALLQVNQELAKPQSQERDLRAQQLIADAINVSKAATDLNPQNPDNWIQRGTVYRSVMGYLSGAENWMLDAFTQATKLEPKNPYAYFELGRSYLLLSDYTLSGAGQDKTKQAKAGDYLNKAEEQFNKAVELKNDYAPAHYELALIYDRQGKIDSAIAKMEITKVNYPNDIGIAFQLGLLYYKEQDWSKAQAEFERAVTLDANYSNARYFLGLIYDRQGNKNAAIEQFKKIAELNPDNTEVATILSNLKSGKAALTGIVPPEPAPENRSEVPVNQK